jgi:uncharacterized membrane protein
VSLSAGAAHSKIPRIEALDALRGAALVGMFAFHLTWDLGYFQLIPPHVPFLPGFMAFGHTVAATFLALVGASLVLALPDGRPTPAYWRRLGLIVLAAAGISAVTYWLFPDSFIFFGILHCIAVGSLLALAFLRAPLWLVVAAAVLCFALPFLVASSTFDAPAWWWLGLGTHDPRSNDWRPLVPWFGLTLAGLAAMRFAIGRPALQTLAAWRGSSFVSQMLIWGGRHSLLVYLVHQPIFLAIVFLLAQAIGPQVAVPARVEDGPFLSSCTNQCVATGADAGLCRNVCSCVAGEVRRQPPIWQRLVSDALSPADNEAIKGFTQQCVRRGTP